MFLTMASLPLDYYDGYLREHSYGFSTQNSLSWLLDRVKGLGVTTVAMSLFVLPLYAVIRRFPRAWWVLGSTLACLFATFLAAVAPLLIAPLFNEFTPLEDRELRATILDLAARNGIHAEEVFQVDASSRSAHDNAYVAGLLGTERIVLYDTLLGNYESEEVAFVMGHEMGHYVLGHLWKGLALGWALIVGAFYVVQRSFRWVLERYPAQTGLSSPGDLATLPLMMLIVSAVLFVTLPIQNAYSRSIEMEADRFALGTVEHPEAGPGAFRKMAARNLADPDPPAFIEWFLYTHPSIGKRIHAAEEHLKKLPVR
jgi:STE24 endopeptidase